MSEQSPQNSFAFSASALTAPFGSLAQQQGKVWRIGFLAPLERPASIEAHWWGAFVQGMREQKAGALLVFLNPFFEQQRSQIAALALKHRLPAMTADRMYAEAGCLMSYGASLAIPQSLLISADRVIE